MSKAAQTSRLRVRWWPAALLVAILATRLSFLWLGSASSTQARVVPTLKSVVLISIALLLWALLFSRFSLRARIVILLSVILAGLALVSTVRITGVTGDGEGWSSFAVLGAAAVTQEQRGDQEMVVRYDLESGRQVWAHADRTALLTTVGGRGPRATPTIADGHVYSLGATGILNCLELATGRLVWSRNVVEEHGARLADYGLPSSPLVVDDLVIVQIAQAERSLVAYRRSNGELAWRSGSGPGSYSSPILATLDGIRQVLIVNKWSVAGHLPETGRLLWSEDWRVGGDKITPPLVIGPDRILVSAGYGAGSRLLYVRADGDGLRAEEVWRSPRLKSKFGSMVAHRGTVYGLDDGVLTALAPATGERLWKAGRYGHGQMILVGDLLLIQTEKGDVVLVEASPDEHRELARLEALSGKTWNPPALAGRLLLVRNNREAVCIELPVE